jgi:preprotein translocase subunit YajC
MNLFVANAAAQPQGGGWATLLTLLPWLIFIFVFYYMFIMAPMKKKQKQFAEMMSKLKSGDRVVTNSGIYGVVTGITETVIKVRIANNVVVEMDKSAIAGPAAEGKEEKKQ